MNKGSYVSHLTPKQHKSVANLVGSKCMISGLIGGAQVKLLWDTGSEVSIVSQDWVEANLPNREIKNISEILEEGRELTLKAANGMDIPYIGYIEASIELKDSACPITVPFLVTEENFDPFILGYNVIELIVAERSNVEHEGKVPISEVLSESFSNMSSGNIHALINFFQTSKNGILCDLKTTKNDVIIPPKQSVKVVCRANTDGLSKKIPALFQPSEEPSWPSGIEIPETLVFVTPGKSSRVTVCVENTTDHPITLKNRSCIGRLELVKSVTPLEVQQKDLPDRPEKQSSVEASTKCNETPHTVDNIDSAELSQNDQNSEDVGEIEIPQDSLLNDIDLSTLNKKQKRAAVKMLIEEESSFAKRDSDIGCATDLQLEMNLTDTKPVQKKYTSIPRPLFPEVKQYIEYLLNKQWILKSKSNYSSPVVAVRKRDGELRLCVDFRELNNRSLPDRHPIRQVTDTLESLGGNDWFSLLDQGKAYHQGFVHPDSQYLTVFITL